MFYSMIEKIPNIDTNIHTKKFMEVSSEAFPFSGVSSFSSKIRTAFLNMIHTITANGMDNQFGNRTRISISISNWITVICLVFSIPFLFIFSQAGHGELVVPPVLICLACFILLRRRRYLAARLLLVNLLPLSLCLLAILTNTTDLIAAKAMFMVALIIPLLVFRLNELRYIIGSLLFNVVILFSIDYINSLLPDKILRSEDLNISLLQTVCMIETVAILVGGLFYYKYLIERIARQNYYLIRDMRAKNEKIQQTNEDLKVSEQQLKDMNDSKTRLFSIIAHDLRSPMNSFRGFSGLLLNNIDALSKEDIKVLVKGMSKSFNNVNTLLENLLHWSRVQMKTVSYQPESVDLSILVEDNLNLVEAMAADKEIQVSASTCDDLYAFVDKNVFNVVLRNLLTNAIKFTHARGKIEVRIRRKASNIRVEVADNGVGMNRSVLETLFTSTNHHYTSTGTANERGTGLGLMLCKEFVEKWGGTITVKSTKGKGSTFIFTVPAYQNPLFCEVLPKAQEISYKQELSYK